MATIINADTSDGLKLTSDTSGQIDLQSAGSTKATIDTSGNLKFNSGYGSVDIAYGVRAWVNFNGTGTVAIRDSGNVSSITDHGTGQYTANFTTNMPDVNYCVHLTGSVQGTVSNNGGFNTALSRVSTPAVDSVRFETYSISSFADQLHANVSIVR